MKTLNRRGFLRNSFYASLCTSVRASVIGVPGSFLVSGNVYAATSAKFTILSQSKQGEPINCSGPMTFSSNGNDASSLIEHPTEAELGASVRGTVAGTNYSAKDLGEATEISLGGQKFLAAKPWRSLPQGFLDNLACVWHRTGANAHPEMPAVKRLMGACRDDENPSVEEEIASAIAYDNADALGCALNTPIMLSNQGSAGFSKGRPLTIYKPRQIKSLFSASAGSVLAPDVYDEIYSQTIDMVYSNLKANGSKKQRAFLDNHALTRAQARDLGDRMGSALDLISGDKFIDQLRTAIAFLKLGVTPVVCVSHDFAGDNHSDNELEDETTRTLVGLDSLAQYWTLVNEAGMADQINLITLDCFGRTPIRNEKGGRDHYGNMTLGLMHGSNFKAGMVGGLDVDKKNRPVATGFNSATGATANPDIDASSTLAAYGKTIMHAAGISESKQNVRVPSGKVISAVFKG